MSVTTEISIRADDTPMLVSLDTQFVELGHRPV
jgi:hypothetical protein